MLESQQVLQGRYQLQHQLGRTGAGRQTWLAVDRDGDREEPVIIKLLAFNPQMQWDEFKLFEREAQVLQALDHPRIPKYRDYFSIEERVLWFGLVQQYIPGSSLQEVLDQDETLTEAEARQLAVNVLHILDYLHTLKPPVLHRDIKPSNLIFGDDGYTYLVDFGAVQDQAAITGVTFTVVGTCGYTPLEQFWGRAVPASDLYALGATLVHLLTGIAPAELPQRRSRMQFAELVNLTPLFQNWLEKLTDPAPENRFASAQEALEALESGVIHRSTEAGSLIRKMQKPERSRIQLKQSFAELRICIPPAGFWERLAQVILMGHVGFLISCIVAAIAIPTTGVFLGVAGLTVLLGWIALLAITLVNINERTYVELNDKQFSIIRKSFRFTWQRQEEPTSNIVGIIVQQLARSERKYDVVIRTEKRAYSIRSGLTELEAIWLVQEIQDWLKLR